MTEVTDGMVEAAWKACPVGRLDRHVVRGMLKAAFFLARTPPPKTHMIGDDGPRYSMKRMRDELRRARQQAMEQNTAIVQAGKHLAVKLAEVYRTAGQKPADCQAIRDWMTALANTEGSDV